VILPRDRSKSEAAASLLTFSQELAGGLLNNNNNNNNNNDTVQNGDTIVPTSTNPQESNVREAFLGSQRLSPPNTNFNINSTDVNNNNNNSTNNNIKDTKVISARGSVVANRMSVEAAISVESAITNFIPKPTNSNNNNNNGSSNSDIRDFGGVDESNKHKVSFRIFRMEEEDEPLNNNNNITNNNNNNILSYVNSGAIDIGNHYHTPETSEQQQLLLELNKQRALVKELKGTLVKYKVQTKQLREVIRNLTERMKINNSQKGSEQTEKDKGWEIQFKELSLIKMIGKGNFGEVWKGEWRGCSVAIKKVSDSAIFVNATQFRQEANIMKYLTPKTLFSFSFLFLFFSFFFYLIL
jgi:uncharacterized coiled-coil protein SlyX